MRDFLQSGLEFKWPPDLGICDGNHCELNLNIEGIPLKWKKKISDKKASIDVYEALPDFNFGKAFVVKTIRDPDSKNARKMTANEVENMRDLRHPHISALLGTFTYQARLNILIFPAACCDLQQFMDPLSEGASTPDSTISDSQQLYSSDTSGQQGARNHSWPLTLPMERRLKILPGYFVCLSQALRYLHEQGVRHKDIKPANILIDKSESVVLTDFGISRRFPKDKSHVTNNEWKFTRKYASPEMMKDKKTPRDDASDVFSLGCVFLEIATLLLENTLDGLSEHCSTTINESAKDESYHRNLEKVHTWIDHLRTSQGFRPVLEMWEPGDNVVYASQKVLPTLESQLTAALVDIRQMLDELPQNRPTSKGLWHQFRDISPKPCRDCDPRSREMWKPSAIQQTAADNGLSNRQSLHAEQMDLENRQRDAIRVANSTILSAPNIPHQSSPRSQDSQGPMDDSRNAVELRPDSPAPELDIGAQNNAAREPESASLKSHLQGQSLGPASPQHIQESVSALSSLCMHGRELETPSEDVGTAKAVPLDQLPTQQIKAHNLSLANDSISRESQPGENKRRNFVHHKTLVSVSEQDMPRPETRIIVYDVSKRNAFQTDCAWLRDFLEGADGTCGGFVLRRYADIAPGQDVLCCSLPRVGQEIHISDQAKFIAKVNLRQLGWRTRLRRWRGRFPRLYVVHDSWRRLTNTARSKA